MKAGRKPSPLTPLLGEYGIGKNAVHRLGGTPYLMSICEEARRVLFSTLRWERENKGKVNDIIDHSRVKRTVPMKRSNVLRRIEQAEALTAAEKHAVRREMLIKSMGLRRAA